MSMDKQYYYGKASSLIEKVESHIGFDKESGLIRDGSNEGMFLDSFENASLGICYVLQGREGEAKRILRGIEKYIRIDSGTGLVYNKKGLSEDESGKVLPGEKKLYLSNQALFSTLASLVGEKERAQELQMRYEKEIGTFEFETEGKKYSIYKHGKGMDFFYPFNNLLVAINRLSNENQDSAEKLVKDIKELCWDDKIGLLRAKPKESVFFTLNNTLLATYLTITGKEEEASKILKKLEDKVGFDKKTGLVFEGFTPRKKIENVLTYANSHLALSYFTLAGMW